MNLFFPFCNKDYSRAVEWMEWVLELGLQKHHIILHPAQEVKDFSRLKEIAEKTFEKVSVEPDREGLTGWPEGPNCAFRQAAWYFYGKKEPWMFMENDAFLLCADALDRLETAYKACGKPFMGDQAPAGKGYNTHMSGVAIYPANMPDYSPKTVMAQTMAFDVYDPDPIVANMHKTPLVQHCFFHPENEIPTFKTIESLSLIRSDAVIFHRNKDLTLIRRLREKMRGATEEDKSEPVTNQIVYTYYDPVPGMPSQEWMLSKWAREWERAGFTPIVLSRRDAETHPHWEELEKRFLSYPTVNPPLYEAACFFRHVAMVQRNGGLLVDYDVICQNGFNPEALKAHLATSPESELPIILLDASPCPCAVFGTAIQFNNAVTWFANNQDKCTKQERGHPHASDQTGVQSGPPWVAHGLAIQYGVPGWESAPMVHYCHAACGGRPREQVIPEAEKLREQMISDPKFGLSAGERLGIDLMNWKHEVKEEIPRAWINKVRFKVNFLLTESKESDNNRTRIMQELKKAGLVPGGLKYGPKKRRKKRKLTKSKCS